jgi:hypothetical protein
MGPCWNKLVLSLDVLMNSINFRAYFDAVGFGAILPPGAILTRKVGRNIKLYNLVLPLLASYRDNLQMLGICMTRAAVCGKLDQVGHVSIPSTLVSPLLILRFRTADQNDWNILQGRLRLNHSLATQCTV